MRLTALLVIRSSVWFGDTVIAIAGEPHACATQQ
jgi:hypothetical protein